jgi:hypothetical protein
MVKLKPSLLSLGFCFVLKLTIIFNFEVNVKKMR